MDQGIAMEWANRLESGKYPQGMYALNRDNKFCCFGVLAEMAIEAGVITRTRQDIWSGGEQYTYAGDPHALTSLSLDWAGMLTTEGQLSDGVNLMGMNDSGESFADIAKVIRERWAEL